MKEWKQTVYSKKLSKSHFCDLATAISLDARDLFCLFFMNLVKDALHDLLVSSGDVLGIGSISESSLLKPCQTPGSKIVACCEVILTLTTAGDSG